MFRTPTGGVYRVVCEGSTNLGGDGSAPAFVSSSCAALKTYFNFNSGLAYIDSVSLIPDPAKAIAVLCANGVLVGQPGSSVATSVPSCAQIASYGMSSGTYYVNGVLT